MRAIQIRGMSSIQRYKELPTEESQMRQIRVQKGRRPRP